MVKYNLDLFINSYHNLYNDFNNTMASTLGYFYYNKSDSNEHYVYRQSDIINHIEFRNTRNVEFIKLWYGNNFILKFENAKCGYDMKLYRLLIPTFMLTSGNIIFKIHFRENCEHEPVELIYTYIYLPEDIKNKFSSGLYCHLYNSMLMMFHRDQIDIVDLNKHKNYIITPKKEKENIDKLLLPKKYCWFKF